MDRRISHDQSTGFRPEHGILQKLFGFRDQLSRSSKRLSVGKPLVIFQYLYDVVVARDHPEIESRAKKDGLLPGLSKKSVRIVPKRGLKGLEIEFGLFYHAVRFVHQCLLPP